MIRALTLSIVLMLCAATARAEVDVHVHVAMAWSAATGTIVVAHDGRIEAFDRSGRKQLWSAEGLASPSAIVTSPDGKSMAILDGFSDAVAVVSVADGAVELHEMPTTPVAAAFFGRDAWIVVRDSSRVVRITPEGKETEVEVALDPALIAVSDQFVYVYSRAQGLLQEIDPKSAQVTRTMTAGTAGSDLEIRLPRPGDAPGAIAYLCRPAHGMIVAIDLVPGESREINVGVAPIDLLFVPLGAQLFIDPGQPVIADPGQQALLPSMHPGPGRTIKQPTATDRLTITAAGIFAFDSNSGTLYRVDRQTATKIASGLTPTSFVATDEALFTWDGKGGRVRRETLGK